MAKSPVNAKVKIRDRDLGWNKVKREINVAARRPNVTVGVHGEQAGRGGPIDNVSLAGVHEFGKTINHPGGTPFAIIGGRIIFQRIGSPFTMGTTDPHTIVIPERSFIRSTIDKNASNYRKLINRLAGEVYGAKLTTMRALDLLGLKVVSDMQRTIRAGIAPPNKPATIRRKGSSKPLIDSGVLLKSLKHKVHR